MDRAPFDRFLNGQTGPAAIVAFLEPLAARIASTDYAALAADPAVWSASLTRSADLLDIQAVAVGFEQAVAAEENRDTEGNALEALDRLRQTEGERLACAGAMPGPIAMAAGMDAAADDSVVATARQASVERAEAFCEKRPDLLILREGAALGQSVIGMPARKAFNTLRNMASYFSTPLALYLEDYDPATLADLGKLRIPVVFLGPDKDGAPPAASAAAALADSVESVSVPVPFEDGDNALALARAYRAAFGERPLAFHNLGAIAPDCDLTAVRSLISQLHTV